MLVGGAKAFSFSDADGAEIDLVNDGDWRLASCVVDVPFTGSAFAVVRDDDNSTYSIQLADHSAYSGPEKFDVRGTNLPGSSTVSVTVSITPALAKSNSMDSDNTIIHWDHEDDDCPGSSEVEPTNFGCSKHRTRPI